MSSSSSPGPAEAALRAWAALGGPDAARAELSLVTEALAAAGFALAGAQRSNQLPRLSFADAAHVLELGPRDITALAAGLRRGEGLHLAGLLRAEGEAPPRRPLPELP
ncbi:MAG: hypothetical protein JNM72_13690 [Deltaproteobacteria bacterium]|nr:hypothetical protein [Deltaproteobacteria bacterium]